MQLRSKWLMLFSIVMTVLMLAACSDDNEADDAAEDTEQQSETENTDEEANEATGEEDAQEDDSQDGAGQDDNQTPNNKIDVDADLQTQLEEEPGIDRVMVQLVEGDQKAVNVDLEITQDLDPQEAFDKYGPMIQEKYPDHTIDVIIVQDGELKLQEQL